MQFWSGTASMNTTDTLAVAQMLDEVGFDGMVTSDQVSCPRQLRSTYPDSTSGTPPWPPETPWPDAERYLRARGGRDHLGDVRSLDGYRRGCGAR